MTRSTLVAIIACGSVVGCGSPPTTPSSRPPALPSAGVPAIAIAAGSVPVVERATADLAQCLQAVADPRCFSAARSVVHVATAGATAPGAPANLVASASGSSVTLTWSAPASGDPVVTYVIEAGSASGLANLANLTTNSTLTSFSASGVGNGTYYVRIRAQNAAGTSAASNEAILVVGGAGCTAAPNAPGGLTSAVSGGTVTLSWTAPGGSCAATSYILQAGSASGLSNLANANIGTTATAYVATGVGNGVYYVRVLAVDAFGQSAASNEIVVTVSSVTGTVSVTGTWTGPVANEKGETSAFTLVLSQNGSQVVGSFSFSALSLSASVSGTVAGSVFSFSSAHYFDNSGCGSALTNGSAQVAGTTMQGTVTIVDDSSQQCGGGNNQHLVQFTLTRQ